MIETQELKILVLDDDELFNKLLILLLDSIGYQKVECTQTISEAMERLETFEPDIMILDINLSKNESGIDFAKEVNRDRNIPIIFITSNYAQDIYHEAKAAGPCQFLDKQLSELKLRQAIELTILQSERKATKPNSDYQKIVDKLNLKSGWFIRKGKYLKKVDIQDIQWIESEGKYCMVYTHDNSYAASMPLKEVADRLVPYNFIRIHRSFIINREKIQVLDLENNFVRVGENEIPIGRNYRKELITQLENI